MLKVKVAWLAGNLTYLVIELDSFIELTWIILLNKHIPITVAY